MKKISILLIIIGLLPLFCLHAVQSVAQTFNKDEYARRRQEFMKKIKGGIAIFKSNTLKPCRQQHRMFTNTKLKPLLNRYTEKTVVCGLPSRQ